jgi:PAS domain-containing protein
MAKQVVEQNAQFIASKMEIKAEIGLVEKAEGVRLALLVDLDSRIIAPAEQLNQYITSGPEALYIVKARQSFLAGRETGFVVEADDNTVVAIEPLKILNPAIAKNVVVAMAVVSIDTSLSTPSLSDVSIIFAETLILTSLLGGVVALVFYRLTLRPYQVLNEDMDRALKGDLPQVSHEYKLSELNSLWDIINSAIQRIPKGSESGNNGMGGVGDKSISVEEYLGPMRMLGEASKMGLAVFDSEKKISYINPIFEELSGIRLDSAIGQSITDVARDQAMGIFTNELLNKVSLGDSGVFEDFEFSGVAYRVHASAFGAIGGALRCYVILVVKADG